MVDFSQISPEILHNVFLHFVDLPSGNTHDIGRPGLYRSESRLSTPLFLGHVCSSWRRVVCSSPTLWSEISLHRPSEHHVPLLDLWLIRSRDAPLTLYLQSMETDLSISQHKILYLLLQHSWRWKRLIVHIHGLPQSSCFASELAFFLASKAFKFPILESVVMQFSPQMSNQVFRSMPLWNLLFEIPSLLSVVVPVPCLRPHATLTEIFCYAPMAFNDVLNTLSSCPNLQSIDVRLSSCTSRAHRTNAVCVNHGLSSLRLRKSSDDPGLALPLLLDNLTLTNLVELDIYSDGNTTEELRAIHNMILRSDCHLLALSTLHVFGSSESVAHLLCLPQLQNLRRLSLQMATKEILDCLIIHSGGAGRVVLPCLEFLEVDNILPPVGSTLSDLLLSRRNSLRAANFNISNRISHIPLDDRLLLHPEYRVMVQEKGLSMDMMLGGEDSLGHTSHDEYVLDNWFPKLAI